MNDLPAKILLDAPKSDLVLIFSASWYVWACIGLVLVAVVGAIAAKLAKKNPPQ